MKNVAGQNMKTQLEFNHQEFVCEQHATDFFASAVGGGWERSGIGVKVGVAVPVMQQNISVYASSASSLRMIECLSIAPHLFLEGAEVQPAAAKEEHGTYHVADHHLQG